MTNYRVRSLSVLVNLKVAFLVLAILLSGIFVNMVQEIRRVAVIGSGLMGSGIAQVTASSNFFVTLVDVKSEVLEKALKLMEIRLLKDASKKYPDDKAVSL